MGDSTSTFVFGPNLLRRTEGRILVASVIREPETARENLEVDWFRDTITVIQLMDLSRSTRADIATQTRECIEHLKELLREDLGADQDDNVMRLFRRAYAHVELSKRPTARTSAYDAFTYMRDTATVTFELLKVYVAKRGAEALVEKAE
ncbi:hypothetical protein ACGFX8_24330 [Streptomyces sp. NPDC048362]|uniref:hypothetical protein n=1 Tax=Streptomyces sp. NPDC048362 TaxID=3365539 RepID=UPI00371636DF